MKLPTLTEFWNKAGLSHRNADVQEPEFARLYCRTGFRYLPVPGQGFVKVDNLLQIANLTAKKPKHGAFKRLMLKIDHELRANVFVENVLNQGFAAGLRRMGFIELETPPESPPCFLKMAELHQGATL